ncbi:MULTISPECIES: F0F1 ATP synthase subunit delta [Gammaproteobacteria]|uniref:ATP synthase subunit delta n=1 Tax=Oceanimonas baumannii TaxID=129578 RepID=A0A235CDV2_9GAMM|nr:F0F1 ATP synthase subunit delta [Oceanimonas baumannii]MCC4264531.1 F0F1 ATP synthase subunit delta [Oceanimonas baumannii]OYD22712.1 F0F1 ATP synthase subunit delta [Oceanimonas baumannii]TDW57677.1 F-type H+-transporting ATPase subunit delta [Oceanimonas baumannii]
MEMKTIARPYAKAAFDFAVEKKAVDNWLSMLTFAAEVAQNDSMAQVLGSDLNAEKMADVFLAVCGEQLDEQGQNLIRVMAVNGRLSVLPAVVREFAEMKAELDRVVDADVVSAARLTKQQVAKIQASLEQRLGRKVNLNCSVDKSLMAGIIIKAGDMVIDGSVRGRLSRLAETLQS